MPAAIRSVWWLGGGARGVEEGDLKGVSFHVKQFNKINNKLRLASPLLSNNINYVARETLDLSEWHQ